MNTIWVSDARVGFSKLLDRGVKGERFTVTRHGFPVAVIAPNSSSEVVSVKESIKALLGFRKERRLDGLTVSEMTAEGRD